MIKLVLCWLNNYWETQTSRWSAQVVGMIILCPLRLKISPATPIRLEDDMNVKYKGVNLEIIAVLVAQA